MRAHLLLLSLLICSWPGEGRALTPVEACLAPVEKVERLARMPAGLLRAMVLIESGYGAGAWPWALNVAGKTFYPPTIELAGRLMRSSNGRVRDDVHVGCLQVSPKWHAEAVPDPNRLLDPFFNVGYAAWYLARLRQQCGYWTCAVAHFGAATPNAGRNYVCLVMRKRIELGSQPLTVAGADLCADARRP